MHALSRSACSPDFGSGLGECLPRPVRCVVRLAAARHGQHAHKPDAEQATHHERDEDCKNKHAKLQSLSCEPARGRCPLGCASRRGFTLEADGSAVNWAMEQTVSANAALACPLTPFDARCPNGRVRCRPLRACWRRLARRRCATRTPGERRRMYRQ